MPTLDVYSKQEVDSMLAERDARYAALFEAYVANNNDWIPTDQALRKAGIRTRNTLEKYARASRPEAQEAGRITFKKDGKKCLYSLKSCIDYAQRKLGQVALAA